MRSMRRFGRFASQQQQYTVCVFPHAHMHIFSTVLWVLSRCGSSQQKVQAASIHMTAQELCCAVASTLAGGKLPAEAVVHEDPAVLRLRLAAVTGT